MSRGFPKEVRALIDKRAGGNCERCGSPAGRYEYHHRRPRGMGGSRADDTNTAANAVLLCPACHAAVESKRELAYQYGYLVRQGHDPADTPIWRLGAWVVLGVEGNVFVPLELPGRCQVCGFDTATQGHRSGCQVAS